LAALPAFLAAFPAVADFSGSAGTLREAEITSSPPGSGRRAGVSALPAPVALLPALVALLPLGR
jgi:hypothetical protein